MGNATLNRFFSFHFLLPFVILALVGIHLVCLHAAGSSNPLGVGGSYDKIFFYPYFLIKDFVGFGIFIIILSFMVCFSPLVLVDSENFIMANSLITPIHIQPE